MRVNKINTQTWDVFIGLLRWHVLGDSYRPSCQDLESINKNSLNFLIDRHRLDFALSPLIGSRPPTRYLYQFLNLQKSLVDLFRAFNEDGIFVISLKGVSLNHLLYNEKCMRRSGDIDLWISPDRLLHAHKCLLRLGFSLSETLNPETLLSSSASSRLKHFKYSHLSKRVSVELHQRLSFTAGIPFPLQQNCHFVTVLGTSIPIPELASYFVYLCKHAALHNWTRLQWLVDVAVFYERLRPNWTEVMRISRETDSTRAMLESTLLLHSFFGIDLPPIRISVLDRFFARVRLHYAKKYWYIDLPHWKVILLNSFLYSHFPNKWQLIIGYILNSRYGKTQILRFSNSPIWCSLKILVTYFTKREFRNAQSI